MFICYCVKAERFAKGHLSLHQDERRAARLTAAYACGTLYGLPLTLHKCQPIPALRMQSTKPCYQNVPACIEPVSEFRSDGIGRVSGSKQRPKDAPLCFTDFRRHGTALTQLSNGDIRADCRFPQCPRPVQLLT